MSNQFLDLKEARQFAFEAFHHYEKQKAPGWFTNWLDDLYIRLSEDWRKIPIEELFYLQTLKEKDEWIQQHFAVNSIYHLFDRLGRDTSGIMGY